MTERRHGEGADLAAVYEQCAGITRTCARNFYYGIRLLPPSKRRAICALYALARHIDDIGDESLQAAEKLDQLAQARMSLRGPARSFDPVVVAVLDAARRFPIPLDAFSDLVSGVEMDVHGTSYRTFEDLSGYCRCVAGSIGRLSLGVLGTTDPGRANELADTLGIAMQVTNILRDIREDAACGRVYLPSVDLARFDCAYGAAATDDPWFMNARFADLVRFQAMRAVRLFEEGLRLVELLDRRSAACVSAVCGIYCRLLDKIAREPNVVLAGRMSLPASEKATIVARALAGNPILPTSAAGARPPQACDD